MIEYLSNSKFSYSGIQNLLIKLTLIVHGQQV